jgi:SAM-dependent methyltransferase
MTRSVYDEMGDFYYEFVQSSLAAPESVLNLATQTLFARVGDVRSLEVCDLACGEGHVARSLAQAGARVTAIDLSSNLLAHARRQSQGMAITFIQDDAQVLTHLSQATFDVVVSNMAMMDIPQIDTTFGAVQRVLRPGGRFLFTLLHPCYEAPFYVPERPFEVDEAGKFLACRVYRYAEEGLWYSGGTGMRGTHGAYHRTLATYINTLIATGFAITHFAEPLLPPGDYAEPVVQQASKIPRILLVEAQKV